MVFHVCSTTYVKQCFEIILAGYSVSNKPNPQGEILICGANVVKGYFKNKDKTNEDFIMLDGRRWFCTGDIGEFHPDGVLTIIDRKKDLVKLSHGEYISLGKVETALLTSPLIDNICVHGNSFHTNLIAFVVPNRKLLVELSEKLGVKNSSNFDKLCSNQQVIDAVLEDIGKYSKQRQLEKFEVPVKIHLCTEIWTAESGLLTEALKLKRKPIEDFYKKNN